MAVSTSSLLAARASSTAAATVAPASRLCRDQVAPTMTKSISTSTPPAVPKWRGQMQGRSLALRSITPASSGTSRVDSSNMRAAVSASNTRPRSKSTEFSSFRSKRRSTQPTVLANSIATITEPPKV